MHAFSPSFPCLNRTLPPTLTAMLLVAYLTGCGSGESSSPPPVISSPPISPVNTTALSAHRAPNQYQFSQFNQVIVTVDMPQLVQNFTGRFFSLRVQDNNEHTYLNVLQTEPQKIEYRLNVPLHITSLTLIINDEQGSTPLTKEITL